ALVPIWFRRGRPSRDRPRSRSSHDFRPAPALRSHALATATGLGWRHRTAQSPLALTRRDGMPVTEHLPHYHAYLLRCWAEGVVDGAPAATWRYSLEDPRTGRRQGFADLPGLIAFLRAATASRQRTVLREARTGSGA